VYWNVLGDNRTSKGETMTSTAAEIHCVVCRTAAPHEGARWRPRSCGYVCERCASRCACGAHVEEPTRFDISTGDPVCDACVAQRLANVTLRKAIETEAVKKFADRLATALERKAAEAQRWPDGIGSLRANILCEAAQVARETAEDEEE
jgi:hypothetical protein